MGERKQSGGVDAKSVSPDQPTAGNRLLQKLLRSIDPRPVTRLLNGSAAHVVQLCRELLQQQFDVSSRRTREVLEAYAALQGPSLDSFFDSLASDFGPDLTAVTRAVNDYQADPSEGHFAELQRAIESPRQDLFRRLNTAPGATVVLVEMRKRILAGLAAHPNWGVIDTDLMHLFRSWFNAGFLTLQRIEWSTSALILERLIEYEAVHQIRSWLDLRRRLEADRRCYAFFHHALPDEPLIFIEVALTRGVASRVQPLLDPDAPVADPNTANCAMFYSITNCQDGLRGISFGNFLIKEVVEDLGRRFRRITTFSTISPIPGFVSWLVKFAERSSTTLSPGARQLLQKLRDGQELRLQGVPADVRSELMDLCAHYLLNAKRGHAPLDPVARFHLANGARLDRINWMGDTSDAGLSRALGMTVNYRYRLDELEGNHELYANDHKVVASRAVEKSARQVTQKAT